MKNLRLCLLAAGLLTAASAFATITDVSPFSGDLLENYDGLPSQDVQLFLPNPLNIMGGQAVLSTSEFPGLAVYDAGAHQFGNTLPTDGTQYLVTQNFGLTMRFEFGSEISRFGGFWSSVGPSGEGQDLHVTFLDANSLSVGSLTAPTAGFTPDGVLPWLGWSSDTPFTAVEIQSGGLVMFDSTRAGTVPEPASIVLLSLGVISVLRRRKQ